MSLHEGVKRFQGVLLHSRMSEADFRLVKIDPSSLPPEEVIGFRIEGHPEMAARTIWVSDNRCTAVNVEKCGPCKVIGTHFTEVFYLLAGRWTAKRPDGTEYEVKAGDFVCFAEGQAEEYTVHETFVKFALYHSNRPLPYEVTP